MPPTPLTPFCLPTSSGSEDCAAFHAILETPLASALGLRAVALRFALFHGQVSREAAPVFLLDDPATMRIAEADPFRRAAEAGLPEAEVSALVCRIEALDLPDDLQREMFHIASDRLWLLVFPRLLIMQANDIAQEIRLASSFNPDLTSSNWARSACATLRLAPPGSAHERIDLLRRISEALAILRDFRPEALAGARDAGYDLGRFGPGELQRALSEG